MKREQVERKRICKTCSWNLPVDGPLVGFKLGLWVKRHTDRGISCCRGCWDVDLCGLGVLLSVARHLGRHKAKTRGTT